MSSRAQQQDQKSPLRSQRSRETMSTDVDCLPCHITKLEAVFEDGKSSEDEDASYSCITDSHKGFREMFDIVLPEGFLASHSSAIEGGWAHFCVPGGFINDSGLVVIPEGSELQEMDNAGRKLEQSNLMSGKKALLAVRVKSSYGEEPDETLEEIEGAIFGTGSNSEYIPAASVVTQYKEISHGALTFTPATGSGISGGVMEIELESQVAGSQVQTDLISKILEATSASLGPLDQVADRIIFCIPNNSTLQEKDTWTAFTFLQEPYSFYQKSRCTKLSVALHELGHSFGLRHSGTTDNDYADESCIMGYAVNEFGGPRKAFNAHKHWLAGWFRSRSVEVNPAIQGAVGGRLASFVDYGNPDLLDSDVVLVRVGNLYVQYNRAKGYNIGSPASYRDRVIITEAAHNLEISVFQAGIAKGQSFVYPDFQGSHDLVIQVCDQISASFDYAVVSFHLNDGVQTSACNGPDAFDKGTVPASSDTDDVWGQGAGTLVSEGDDRSEMNSKMNSIAIGVVWGLVGLLLVITGFLVYRIRLSRKREKSRSRNREKQRRKELETEVSFSSTENDNVETESAAVIEG